jgi:hypothetical protein
MSYRSWRASRRTRVVEMAFVRDVASWDWWVTLTHGRWVERDRSRSTLRSWLRGVARDLVGDHVTVAWVLEPNRRGVDHAHVLLAVPEGKTLDRAAAEALWRRLDPRAGFTQMVRYRPGKSSDPRYGAAAYLSDKTDWNLTVACNRALPCRRKGCTVLSGPWF